MRRILSTKAGDEGGSWSVSLYSVAPPMTKTRFTLVLPEACVSNGVNALCRSARKIAGVSATEGRLD